MVFGASGQDGAYLSRSLLDRGYRVIGTFRGASESSKNNLRALGIDNRVTMLATSLSDFDTVFSIISDTRPSEIYNLAGLSSVGLSFEQPRQTLESIALGTLNVLESIRRVDPGVCAFFAGSSECFGETHDPASELTPFHPKSPYAIAKTSAYWLARSYRETYGLFACTGILFNHESPLRPDRFVTRRIVNAARSIAAGSDDHLSLGDISVVRDWGWAPEYVEPMWLMLQQDHPDDYIIATGHSHSLEHFVECVFSAVDLDWRQHVTVDTSRFRPTDIRQSMANPEKASTSLNWRATTGFESLISKLVAGDLD